MLRSKNYHLNWRRTTFWRTFLCRTHVKHSTSLGHHELPAVLDVDASSDRLSIGYATAQYVINSFSLSYMLVVCLHVVDTIDKHRSKGEITIIEHSIRKRSNIIIIIFRWNDERTGIFGCADTIESLIANTWYFAIKCNRC